MYSKKQAVNFLSEIRKYHEWEGHHRISTGQSKLFMELQMQFNLHHFAEWFPVSISDLHDYTHLSTRAIYNARNVLKQRGLIDFKKGENDTVMALYKVHLFDEGNFYSSSNKSAGQSADHSAGQSADHSAGQSATFNKHETGNNIDLNNNARAREKNLNVKIPIFPLGKDKAGDGL